MTDNEEPKQFPYTEEDERWVEQSAQYICDAEDERVMQELTTRFAEIL